MRTLPSRGFRSLLLLSSFLVAFSVFWYLTAEPSISDQDYFYRPAEDVADRFKSSAGHSSPEDYYDASSVASVTSSTHALYEPEETSATEDPYAYLTEIQTPGEFDTTSTSSAISTRSSRIKAYQTSPLYPTGTSSMVTRPSSTSTSKHKPVPHNSDPSLPVYSGDAVGTDECQGLEDLDDMLIVLRTGATESLEKLPVHFKSTFRCVPNFILFSDMAEMIAEHELVDGLKTVSDDVKESQPEFELYNRLKDYGRKGMKTGEEMEGDHGHGWKLDKWKFLPLIDKALEAKGDAKWFIWIEADTYLVLSNLVRWLARFDASRPWYMGAQTQIASQVFAHGGTGFVTSNSAMKAASVQVMENAAFYDRYAADNWAGDCILSKALQDAGIELTWTWPITQGQPPSGVDPTEDAYGKRLWCYPAVTYHHIDSEEVPLVYEVDHAWMKEHPQKIMYHSDMFKRFVMPRLKHSRDNWDNINPDLNRYKDQIRFFTPETSAAAANGTVKASRPEEIYAHSSFEACQELCESLEDCMQWRYAPDECVISGVIRLGRKKGGSQTNGGPRSGWMFRRIASFVEEFNPCNGEEGWILS